MYRLGSEQFVVPGFKAGFFTTLDVFPFRDDSIIMQGGLKPNHLNWEGMHDVLWLVQSTAHCARLKLN